jgi:hypothetical protein
MIEDTVFLGEVRRTVVHRGFDDGEKFDGKQIGEDLIEEPAR